MRPLRWICAAALAFSTFASRTALSQTPGERFPDAREKPPAGWAGPVFKLSQDYPATKPPAEPRPWKAIDYKTKPAEYLTALRDYCYEGNIQVDWRGQDNAVRKWFHVPWMDTGPKGREFIHGMGVTSEIEYRISD